MGGYFGAWLLAEAAWQVPMSHAALKAAGGAMGAGMVIVLPVSSCGLAETARVLRYLADENAGQCGPCMFGLPALADAMADLAYQGGRGRALERVASLAGLVAGRGACRHPDGAVQLVRSALRAFEADALWHDSPGPCPGCGPGPAAAGPRRRGLGLGMNYELRVNPIACTGHGLCGELLPEIIELDPWGYPHR